MTNPLSLETSDLDPITPEEDALATKAIVAMGWTRQAHDSAVRMVRVVLAEVTKRHALIAECAFDDRGRSRVGHHSQIDWEDGYRDGTRAAAAAIRSAHSIQSGGEGGEG